MHVVERLAHMEEEERKLSLKTKKLIAMRLAVEHVDTPNRERSLSRSSGSTASEASVRSVSSLSRSSGNTASGASGRSVPSSSHTMTVCKAFSSVNNQIAPAISTTQVLQPKGHVGVFTALLGIGNYYVSTPQSCETRVCET